MYRVVRASTLYYEDNMKDSKSRYELILPFMLLTDTHLFNNAKETVLHNIISEIYGC